MRRKSNQTRLRIIEAAYAMFYRRGFARVGVDDIAARAKVTKRTLYGYFRSKDDLLAAAFSHFQARDRERLQVIASKLPKQPGGMVEQFFALLTDWAARTPRWTGSGFTRAAIELADMPGHPARAIARRAKESTENWLVELLAQENVAAPQERAREIMLLMEGAMALMLIHGDGAYGKAAALAAKRLVKDR